MDCDLPVRAQQQNTGGEILSEAEKTSSIPPPGRSASIDNAIAVTMKNVALKMEQLSDRLNESSDNESERIIACIRQCCEILKDCGM